MKQFDNVVREFRTWFITLPFVDTLLPLALYIAGGSLFLKFFYVLVTGVFHKYFGVLATLSTLGHLGFLLGFWLLFAAGNFKFAAYALFTNAFILLFPFTSFSLYEILNTALYGFLGYQLYRYALHASGTLTNDSNKNQAL